MEQLKRLREERGLSQVKLAARADIDPSTVNQIERGAREPSPATLRKLADALDVSIADLFEDAAPKVVAPPSLFNGLEEERRYRPNARDIEFLDRYFARVEQRMNEGKMRRAEVEHELDVLRAFGPAVYAVVGDEVANRILGLGHELLDEAKRLKSREIAEAEAGVRRLEELREQRAS